MKIKFPARVSILSAIKKGSVYYFEDDQLSSTEPHYFVVLNSNPHTSEVLFLVCASSRVEKKKKIAQRLGFHSDTLVFISPAEYKLFTRETVINCNDVFEKSSQSLIEKLDGGKLGLCLELMPKDIIQKLIKGVLASNQVARGIKEILESENVSEI
jgi:hypothetical protein